MSQITVEGLDKLNAALKELADDVEKKLLRRVTRKAATLFRDAMRAKVPRSSHHRSSKRPHLADDIKVRMKKAQPGQADARIGPSKKTAFIANWLEWGTKPHTIKGKKGKPLYIPGTGFVESIKHPGAAAKPFLRPAFDEQVTKVIDQFKTELGSAIEKAAKK